MTLYDSKLYMEDVRSVAGSNLPWDDLKDKRILLSGATGLIGSFFVDVILEKNKTGLNCTVYALGRSDEKARNRFGSLFDDPCLIFIP